MAKAINRRSFLIGAATSLLAAPAIVRFSSLMPVRNRLIVPIDNYGERQFLDWARAAVQERYWIEKARRQFLIAQYVNYEYVRGNLFEPYLE